MLVQSGTVNLSLVKAFYANLNHSHSSSFSNHLWVRGKNIVVTPDIWSHFLEIGRPEYSMYPLESMAEGIPNIHFDIVASFLTKQPYEWLSGILPYSLPEYRLLNLIVCHNIEPLGHHMDITHERGYVFYAIANGLHVDLPTFMVLQMCNIAGSTRTVGMPFGVLLTQFLETHSVPTYPDDTYVKVCKKLNTQTVHQSEAHMP